MGSSHPCRSIPDGTPGQRTKAFPDPLAALVLPVMMGVEWGARGLPRTSSLELLPKTRPGLDPMGLGSAMCNIWRVFWGQWEGWETESFPVYSIYVSF